MSPLEVARAFQQAWDDHDLEAVLALVTDDCVFDSARAREGGSRLVGREALRAAWAPSFANPGGTFEVTGTVVEGDCVVQLWDHHSAGGTMRGLDVLRVRDGRICEKSGYTKQR